MIGIIQTNQNADLRLHYCRTLQSLTLLSPVLLTTKTGFFLLLYTLGGNPFVICQACHTVLHTSMLFSLLSFTQFKPAIFLRPSVTHRPVQVNSLLSKCIYVLLYIHLYVSVHYHNGGVVDYYDYFSWEGYVMAIGMFKKLYGNLKLELHKKPGKLIFL